jgi:hypothetical protein
MKKIDRKDFLKNALALAGVTLVGSSILSACGGEQTPQNTAPAENAPAENAPVQETTPAAEAPATPVDCSDLSGLSDADKKQRESVSYVEKSPEAEKNCTNCRFWQPNASDPNACGGCQLIKGPVNPQGYCKSWFKKDA